MIPVCNFCYLKEVCFFEPISQRKFIVKVLIRPNVNHNCPNTIQNVKIVDFPSKRLPYLPSIPFTKLAPNLKERFYLISFPIIRSKLWKCSKLTAWLGPKPEILIGKFLGTNVGPDFVSMPEFLIQNVVIKFSNSVEFSNLKNDDFSLALRFADFQHQEFTFSNSKISIGNLPIICNSSITKVFINCAEIDLNCAVNLMPNLESFSSVQRLGKGWEKMILEWDLPKLEHCAINPCAITDFTSLRKLCERGDVKTCFHLINRPEFDPKQFSKHFWSLKSSKIDKNNRILAIGYPEQFYFWKPSNSEIFVFLLCFFAVCFMFGFVIFAISKL